MPDSGEILVDTDSFQLAGRTLTVVIGVEPSERELQVNPVSIDITFEASLPQFDMEEFEIEPLTCSEEDA